MSAVAREGAEHDVGALLPLMAELYAEDGNASFDHESHRRAVRELLADRGKGRLYVFEDGDALVGYVVVTWGFSLEYGGCDAFIDELYVAPDHRREGLGTEAIRLAEEACRSRGVSTLHLEVERSNLGAQEIYRRRGYHDHDRYLMTKRL